MGLSTVKNMVVMVIINIHLHFVVVDRYLRQVGKTIPDGLAGSIYHNQGVNSLSRPPMNTN